MPACAFCGTVIEPEGKVGRGEECPSCRRDLRACRQCRFHDRSYHNECRENQAASVGDKERANFCEFFVFGREGVSEEERAALSRKKLGELFRTR